MPHLFDRKATDKIRNQQTLFNPLEWNGKQPNEMFVKRVNAGCNPSKMLVDENGKIFHVRSIGTYKRRHPELTAMSNREIMAKYGWSYVDSSGKHRYVYLRGDKWIKNLMFNQIKDKIQEYPSQVQPTQKINEGDKANQAQNMPFVQ